MARQARPWFWQQRQSWFATIRGVRHNLGPERDAAFDTFHRLMVASPAQKPLDSDAVVAVFDEFLEWCQKNRALDTYRWYRDRLQEFAKVIGRTLTVADLKPIHVQRFIDARSVSSGTKRNFVRAVKRALGWAVEQGLIVASPLIHMRKPAAGRRETVISAAEYQTLLESSQDQSFRDLLTVAWETGMRAAEILATAARHLDARSVRLVFARSEEKMERAPRIVYLTDAALQVIQRLAAEYPSGPLFRNTTGIPWNPDSVNCRFRYLRLTQKVPKKYCLTDFRHSFCHRLLAAGVDSLTVATLMGHSNTDMVAKVYSHMNHATEFLRESLQKASQPRDATGSGA